MSGEPNGSAPVIDVQGLSKIWPGETSPVVDEIDISVAPGQAFCLLGGSGSGKSTILRCILGLEESTKGTIRILGRDTGNLDVGSLTSAKPDTIPIGYVSQGAALWPHLDVEGNILLASRLRQLDETRVRARLASLSETLAIEGLMKRRTWELSGGEARRVSIARTLVLSPDVLFLDEITAGLDPELITQVVRLLKRLLGEGKTIILISHNMNVVRHAATHINLVHRGRFVSETPLSRDEFFEGTTIPAIRQFISDVWDVDEGGASEQETAPSVHS